MNRTWPTRCRWILSHTACTSPWRTCADEPSSGSWKAPDDPPPGLIGSSLFAAVMHCHLAGLQAVRRDELEPPRGLQALKQGRPVAGDDRVDDETVLVDQSQPLERGRECEAAHEH